MSERQKPSKRYQLHTYYNSLQKLQSMYQEKIKQHIEKVFYNAISSFEEVIKPVKLTQQQLERVNEIKQYVMIECITKFKHLISQKVSSQQFTSQRLTLQKTSTTIGHLYRFVDNKFVDNKFAYNNSHSHFEMKFKRRILKYGLSNGLKMLEDLFNPIYIQLQGNGSQDYKHGS